MNEEETKTEEQFDLTDEEQTKLIDQATSEIKYSYDEMKDRWYYWARCYDYYRNLRSDEVKEHLKSFSEPLFFSIHNTLLSTLYDDEIFVNFLPRDEGDIIGAENRNKLAEYDADVMELDKYEYMMSWGALFFGRQLALFGSFDRETKTPVSPEVLNMMVFHRDPDARNAQEQRFWGRPIALTKREMEDQGVYFNIDKINPTNDEQIDDYKKDAQDIKNIQQGSIKGENEKFTLMEWYTYFKGKRVLVTLANNHKDIVRYQVLDQQDRWPLIDRCLNQDALAWDCLSVSDLVESAYRENSIIIDSAIRTVKSNQYHIYAFDETKVKPSDVGGYMEEKHIKCTGNPRDAVVPLERKQIANEVFSISDIIKRAAQQATATPDVVQGFVGGTKRTATEVGNVTERADNRLALIAKSFNWSRKDFWRQWNWIYKTFFTEGIDKKMIRINGALGYKWQGYAKSDFVSNIDPDVQVKSKIVSDAKKQLELQNLTNFINTLPVFQQQGVETDPRELSKMYARANGLKSTQIELVFPATVDELFASQENEKLSKNDFVKINEFDDDRQHLTEHFKARDTKARDTHIKAHIEALKMKAKNKKVKAEVEGTEAQAAQGQTQPLQGMQTPPHEFNQPKTLPVA